MVYKRFAVKEDPAAREYRLYLSEECVVDLNNTRNSYNTQQ